MSKVVKGVKKVFRKVVKVVKKIVPAVLAAAAVFFTAGAALVGTAGWAAAAGKVGSLLGTGTLGKTVAGAVYHAGYGAAIGGTVSKLSGGSFTQGAQRGAAIGAVTGGLAGGLNKLPQTDPGNAGTWKSLIKPTTATSPQNLGAGSTVASGPPTGATAESPVAASQSPSAVASGATVAPPIEPSKSWYENPMLGHVAVGLGQGLSARGNQRNELRMMERQNELNETRYAGAVPTPGLMALAPSPQQLHQNRVVFPRPIGLGLRDMWDPVTGLIRRVS